MYVLIAKRLGGKHYHCKKQQQQKFEDQGHYKSLMEKKRLFHGYVYIMNPVMEMMRVTPLCVNGNRLHYTDSLKVADF